MANLKLGVIMFVLFIVGFTVGVSINKPSSTSKIASVQTSTEEQKQPSPSPTYIPSSVPTPMKQTTQVTIQPTPISAPKPPASTKFEISGVVAKQESGITTVYGEVKNNDSVKHSLLLKTTFYDASGKILGTAGGAVNDLEASETKTFTFMGTDNVAGYANIKTQVDSSF